MATLRQIAHDPHKALRDLEKELGANPGDLLRDMNRVAEVGGDWRNHLPYQSAVSYYEDPAVRPQYQGHVDSCEYCQKLLQTLHPSDVQAKDFGAQAARERRGTQPASGWRRVPAYSLPLSIAASILLTVLAVPHLQAAGVLPSPARAKETVVKELRVAPGTLAQLVKSPDPAARYRAAQYYFALQQPQQAYRQIGEGLQLAGLSADDAGKITVAADLPTDQPATTISSAAQRLPNLEAAAARDPADYLEVAEMQAKLGFHDEALRSIERYLKARKVDSKALAEFAEVAVARAPVRAAGP